MDWFDLLAVQGALKSLLQHRSLKTSILRHSAFFMVQLSHPYMTAGKTTTLTIQTFVGKGEDSYTNMYSDGQCIKVSILHILADICSCQPINVFANLNSISWF